MISDDWCIGLLILEVDRHKDIIIIVDIIEKTSAIQNKSAITGNINLVVLLNSIIQKSQLVRNGCKAL